MARNNFNTEIIAVRPLTEKICEYQLRSLDRQPLPSYAPGAHIALHVVSPEHGLMVRHYSLLGGSATHDDPRHTYRIAIQREHLGRCSSYLHSTLKPGQLVRVGPPVNDFPLDRHDSPVLLLAGGIGITPIFSMARSLIRRQVPFQLIYLGRAPHAMAYHDDVSQLCGRQVSYHYSERQGQLDLTALLKEHANVKRVYVCGPPAMIEATHQAALQAGLGQNHVRSERFGVTRSQTARAFDVVLQRSGRTVRIGADATILDTLQAQGIPVLWDCRRGECGLCPLTVLAADGPLEHHDHYLSPEERSAGDSLCICVSRIRGTQLVLDA
ncbi:PDR/VanB family oxidoreductase [Kerstersia similis]|uniref:PDR/VanB family oxidoreductase n=1 Tax=Kerstersia similis TaxID=206505 RepID=UPI0039EFC14B